MDRLLLSSRVASTSVRSSSMIGFAQVRLLLLGTSFLLWSVASGLLGSRSILRGPRSSLLALLLSLSPKAIFLVAPGLDPPISSFSALLLGRRSGVRTCLAGAFLRLGPSWPLSASFQTHNVKTTPQKTRFLDVKYARIWDTD